MGTVTDIAPRFDRAGWLGAATVVAKDAQGRALVRVGDRAGSVPQPARIAASLRYRPRPGDEVLVAAAGAGTLYVAAVLSAGDGCRPENRVRLRDGASATADDRSQRLCVYSESGELVFEYEAKTRKARVLAGAGDLEIGVPDGDLRLSASGDIRLEARRVDLTARAALRLGVRNAAGRLGSTLALARRSLTMRTAQASLTAGRGDFRIEQILLTAAQTLATVGRLRVIAEKVETLSRSVIERTRDLFRSVEGVCQLHAGRVRTLVDGTYHMKSRQTIIRSDEDVKVNADRIHLG